MNFVMNHAPGAGSIARPVDQQSSTLPLYHGRPLYYCTMSNHVTHLESVQGAIILDVECLGVGDRESVAVLAQQAGEVDGFCDVIDIHPLHQPLYQIRP